MAPRIPIERHGVGQSGYTAGRRDRDAALDREVQTEHRTYPKDSEEEHLQDELDPDDRFAGRGGPPHGKRDAEDAQEPHEPTPKPAENS